mmetsp:Transcript_88818/g.250187  ORF Transcript_88818/g.250187 Transcript_88818/m.250187 type:complete len:212 (+) Transcript_88818:726-1361(+)
MLLVLLQVILPVVCVVRARLRHGDVLDLLLHLGIKVLGRNHWDLWGCTQGVQGATYRPNQDSDQRGSETCGAREETVPREGTAICELDSVRAVQISGARQNPLKKLLRVYAHGYRVFGGLARGCQVHHNSTAAEGRASAAATFRAGASGHLDAKRALLSLGQGPTPARQLQGLRHDTWVPLVLEVRCDVRLRRRPMATAVLDRDFTALPLP